MNGGRTAALSLPPQETMERRHRSLGSPPPICEANGGEGSGVGGISTRSDLDERAQKRMITAANFRPASSVVRPSIAPTPDPSPRAPRGEGNPAAVTRSL